MRNAYLEKKNAEKRALIRAAQEMMAQYDVDIFTMVLHRRGYGEARMTELLHEFLKLQEEYLIAFDPNEPEADYYRELLDREMRAVYGEKADPFEVRYPMAKSIFYDRPLRHKKK